MKEKIALVVQRYGLEVNGGSEYSCRLYAEKLSEFYEVDVLTTKALDYMTWNNHYTRDVEVINHVCVRRFPTNQPRDVKAFNEYSAYIYGNANRTIFEEFEWMKKQGPVSYALLRYIKEHAGEYKVFIFFTYTYFTTYFGMQLVPDKSILIPTAHDEPPIYLSIYKPFFHLPRHILFLTEEEKEFVHRTFKNDYISSAVIGIGLDLPENYLSEEEIRDKFNIRDPYVIYVGRIDESKGCKELFDYFIRFKKDNPSNLKLVLMGKAVMDIPRHRDIINLGFVSEEEKYGGMANAICLVMPSKYESLSMVVLESLSLGRPVLVNEECEVLKGHCERSNAGLYFGTYVEFMVCISNMLKDEVFAEKMGKNGHHYINIKYVWDKVINRLVELIDRMDE